MTRSPDDSLQEAIGAILDHHRNPMPLRHLRALLGARKRERALIERALDDMIRAGLIGQTVDGNYYSLTHERTGRVVRGDRGRLQVREEGTDLDFSLERDDALQLLVGDQVAFGSRGQRAHIERVIRRAHERTTGILFQQGAELRLQPMQRGVPEIRVRESREHPAAPGDAAVVQIEDWMPDRSGALLGHIVQVLGSAADMDVERSMILEAHGLQREFPADVEAEANACNEAVRPGGQRRDLRRELTCTIDGPDARDFDDAIILRRRDQGGYTLSVCIADVAWYVRPDSALDREARERATSVYFPAYCIPMLPERLSNHLCSLNPDEDRYSLCCRMQLDARGELESHEIFPAVIRSDRRFTYAEVQQVLDGSRDEPDWRAPLALMAELARLLRQRRFEGGSIDFDRPEKEILVDDQGMPRDIRVAEPLFAHRIIEEFMLRANVTVAEHLDYLGLPGIYRVHGQPESRRLAQFARAAAIFGYQLRGRGGTYHPHELNRLLQESRGRPEQQIISTLLLRSLQRAQYAPEPEEHFGLGFDHYCHFTSPIRRYPDLIVHRVLHAWFQASEQPRARRLLGEIEQQAPGIAEHSSVQERRAQEAEWRMLALKTVQFMAPHLGEEFEGLVSGVSGFGLFVELKAWPVEGLVHISRLSGDFYRFEEERMRLIGRRTRRVFELGTPVRVQLARADLHSLQLDFELLEAHTNKERRSAPDKPPVSHTPAGKKKPPRGKARRRKRR